MFEISCCCVPPWVPLETNPRPLDQSYIDLRSPLSLSLSLIALQQTRVSVSESIFTLDCFSSSSDWARLTWSAKTGPFSQHLAEDLLTSCSIFLFEVCNITDTGSLLGLLQLRFWIFFCLISSVEKLTYEHCQTKPLFSQKWANKQFYYQKKKRVKCIFEAFISLQRVMQTAHLLLTANNTWHLNQSQSVWFAIQSVPIPHTFLIIIKTFVKIYIYNW